MMRNINKTERWNAPVYMSVFQVSAATISRIGRSAVRASGTLAQILEEFRLCHCLGLHCLPTVCEMVEMIRWGPCIASWVLLYLWDELADEESSDRSFLVVVLNVYVYHMHGCCLAVSGFETCKPENNYFKLGLSVWNALTLNDLIINSLFTRNDYVELFHGWLEFFRTGLDSAIAIKHVQQAIPGVPDIKNKY